MTVPDTTFLAVEIERTRAPKDWPRALENVPAEQRAGVETYLRVIAARIRVQRAQPRRGWCR